MNIIKTLKEKTANAEEKIKEFVDKHGEKIVFGATIFSGIVIGAAAHKLYDDAKYGGVRSYDGFAYLNDDGEIEEYATTISPSVAELKRDTGRTHLYKQTKEEYDDYWTKMKKK